MDRLSNRRVALAARPVGTPRASDFRLEDATVPALRAGEIRVRTEYLSLEPAMRGWMDDRPSYLPPVAIGDAMRATGVGRVIQSRHTEIQEGDAVLGTLGVQTVATVDANTVRKVDLQLAPAHVHAGLLSTSGLTAYFGLMDIGRPSPGDTVMVSGAAGAVGSIVGQIAKLHGCRVVGIAGGQEKCAHLVEGLGFDAAVDYKSDGLSQALAAASPDGVDVYFDNVGNPVLDAVLRRINQGARIVLCGAISQYNNTGRVDGPSNYISLIVKRARMEGFIVFDYADRYPEATTALATWWRNGRLSYRTDVVEGLETFYDALIRLFEGRNSGKSLLKLS